MMFSRVATKKFAQTSLGYHGSGTFAASTAHVATKVPHSKQGVLRNNYLRGVQQVTNTASCKEYYQYMRTIMATPVSPKLTISRAFSSSTVSETASKTTKFSNLDPVTVSKIKEELIAADTSKDGYIDSQEFKHLLSLHNQAFSEEEIERLGEVFYAGRAGESVSIDRFIEAIDAIAKDEEPTGQHRAAKKLGIGTCGAEYLIGSKVHAYTPEQLDISLTHKPPEGVINIMSFTASKGVRFLFDAATGWNGEITTQKIMSRVIYLETIAAVPGMVAGIIRHFKSLRAMSRDGGMLNMFLEEALNERMHLLTFVTMRNPGFFFRLAVLGGQIGFGTFYLIAYIISPQFCHTFVGYVEEEACSTYTKIIKAIEEAPEGTDLAAWRTEAAPKIAKSYWHLGTDGTVLDTIYAIRADEAEHRDVNHIASNLKRGDIAPVGNPQDQVDMALRKYVKDLINT